MVLSLLSISPNTNNEVKADVTTHVHTDACYAGHRHTESGCTGGTYLVPTNGKYIPNMKRYDYHPNEDGATEVYTFGSSDMGVSWAGGENIAFTDNIYGLDSSIVVQVWALEVDVNTGNVAKKSILKKTVQKFENGVYIETEEYKKIKNVRNLCLASLDASDPVSYWNALESIGIYCYTIQQDYNVNAYPSVGKTFWSCGLEQDETPICNTVVTSISPQIPVQTVYYGGSINTNATATFFNESIGTVGCTVTNFNPNTLGTQNVTLSYNGLINTAKTTGTLTCDRTVNVIDYVTSIVPLASSQTIYYNGSIDVSANITKASGGTQTVSCDVSGFSPTTVGNQTVTLTYKGMTNNSGTYPSCTLNVTVLPGLTKIEPAFSTQTIYKGSSPDLTATAYYMDNTTKVITPTNDFNPLMIGTQTVTLTYTDQGITKTVSCTVNILPNLTGLTISADKTSVLYGTDITFTVTAHFEDSSSRIVTAAIIQGYDKLKLGNQTIHFSYSENGVTKDASISVEVLDFPVSLDVTLEKDKLYQSQSVELKNATSTLASGAKIVVVPSISDYDNLAVGNKDITFSYTLNGVTVTREKIIEILPDLYELEVNEESFVIYKGQSLPLVVKGRFHVKGEITLNSSDYTISGFDNNVYNRSAKNYTLSYTEKGVTLTKQLSIAVKPNIADMLLTVPPQVTEGAQIPFTLVVSYEDGVTKTLTEADIGKDSGLSIKDYDIDYVGYQDIIFQYTEGGETLTKSITIRVRALINVSIPLSVLISIDSNTGQVYASDIEIDNHSKESVRVSVGSISKDPECDLNDVPPDKYNDWSRLGKRKSNNIAIGLNYASANWLDKDLPGPLYFSEVFTSGKTDIGVIEKGTKSRLDFEIKHGNAFNNSRSFQYVINWMIKLAKE
jgi:hypothetical protein